MRTIGILGAASIAPTSLVDPVRRRDDARIAAVAAARPGAAEAFATRHGIPTAYDDYRRLIDDPAIDLVYIALAVSAHAPWAIAALEAGKDVLVEKPAAMDAAEGAAMIDAARRGGGRLVEAFHYRYHPLFEAVRAERDEGAERAGRAPGAAGGASSGEELRTVLRDAQVFDPASMLHDPAVGGSVLRHAACYPVHWMRTLVGEEPEVLSARAVLNPLGGDAEIEAELRFPSGATGSILASFLPGGRQGNTLEIAARDGARIEVDNLIAPHHGHSLRTRDAAGVARVRTVAGRSSFDHQLDAVLAALDSGAALPTEGADLVANLAVLDAIRSAAGLPAGRP